MLIVKNIDIAFESVTQLFQELFDVLQVQNLRLNGRVGGLHISEFLFFWIRYDAE